MNNARFQSDIKNLRLFNCGGSVVLTAISNFWFDLRKDIVPNQFNGISPESVAAANCCATTRPVTASKLFYDPGRR